MNDPHEALQQEISARAGVILSLKQGMNTVISGQEQLVDRLIIALLTGGHLLVEGVPGLAKTLTIATLAQCVQASANRLQFTPDLLPADIIGTMIYNPQTQTFSTKKGPVFANLILADEINRAPAKVQSALLEAMQERQVTIGGESYALPHPFMVMATQNPLEQEGTYPLPEAQLDRFMMKVLVDYPGRADELEVLRRMGSTKSAPKALPTTSLQEILLCRELVDRIYVDDSIAEYILDIVIATRPGKSAQLSPRQTDIKPLLQELEPLINCGASPRATLAITLAAKAAAFIAGRAYVIPRDVQSITQDVLRHRLALSYEAEAEGISAEVIIQRLLRQLQAP